MTFSIVAGGAALMALAGPADAGAPVAVPAGTPILLETALALSSKTHVKGDKVPLRVAADLVVNGQLVIPAGTEAVGDISDAQARGGFGTSGRLEVRPLYLMVGNRHVRLAGHAAERARPGAVTALGVLVLTPLISGRSTQIAAGTPIEATILRDVVLPAAGP